MAGVPYTYETLKRLSFARMDLPSLKTATQAGGKLNAAIVHEFATLCRDKGMRFVVMYGADGSHGAHGVAATRAGAGQARQHRRSHPRWRAVDRGRPRPARRTARLRGRARVPWSNVTMGYASCRDDLARGDERDGVLRTGDMAHFDEERFFYVVGRRSRFIKIFGNRINLEELEQHIRRRSIDCACSGEDERLRIYITDASVRDTVAAFVQDLTRLHHSAYQLIVVDGDPAQRVRKIQYASLP